MRDDLATLAASINARLATLGAAQKNADAVIAAADRTSNFALAAAVVAVIGVLITAFVTWRNGYLQARVSQQLKHAEFRQMWINALREEMARFQLLTAQSLSDQDKKADLVQSMSMILLRMDRNDEDYDRLVRKMDEVVERIETRGDGGAPANGGTALSDLLLICQDILKREWVVTKAEMNRTPLIWPFDRNANKAMENQRAARFETVAQRRKVESAAVPRHLDQMLNFTAKPQRGKLALMIQAVLNAVTKT